MKIKNIFRIGLSAGLLSLSMSIHAQDIDIYSGLNSTTTIPNIMVVVDNPSSQNNAVAACTYWDGTVPSNGSTALGADQCALANLVHSMATQPGGVALLNLGFTTMSGVNFRLTPVDDNPYTGINPVVVSGVSITIPAATTNRQAIILAIKAIAQTSGKSGQGTELQETWAYYTGGNGTYGSINTAQGSLSGTVYPGVAASCIKNYTIFLSNVKANAGHAQDNGELPYLDASAQNALHLGKITATQLQALDPSAAGYTGTIPNKPEAGYGIEWSRFMYNYDLTSSIGTQNIVTYAVATGDTGAGWTMETYIQDVALYGGGKYFAAGTDPSVLQNDILKIFNEVNSVNSVFASSSLPVSVNAQGTFLNQVFMGMFRPDPNGNPRWLGNLKQYQYIYNTSTRSLELGDSIGNGAISSAGTGFISANAISFWTCANLASNPYLTATPANLTSTQIALLTADKQGCPDTQPNGFWANNPNSTLALARGYDFPDGDRVERGGIAQQMRQSNLTDSYTTSAGSTSNPRNLYTWCPTGAGCTTNQLLSVNPFSTSNTNLTSSLFGTLTTIMPSGKAATSADLINWVRGDDNVGDESSLCPPNSSGVNSTAGSGNCPNPAVTVRPSLHGDVLHSRPTVINYGAYPITITATADSGTTRTATASAADVTTIATSVVTPVVTFANGQGCLVTITSTTTFTYPNTNCGAAGGQTASVGSKVVVFYGDNGGVFHAVNGNQTNAFGGVAPGNEIWGFIPKEFFPRLNRLMSNSPQVLYPSTPSGITPTPQYKDYFVDGTTGFYQVVDGGGNTVKAVIYLSMRRGGNFIYAIDVTNPTNPIMLWRVDNTSAGMSELGQTWSQPKVTAVQGYCGGSACSSTNRPSPVLIFGAGYDVNEDTDPPANVDASGRGIFVLDALTGAKVWSATYSSGGTTAYTGNTSAASALVAGMNYSIPADITLVDRDFDGYTDRLYAADTGGNIWRVDLEPSGNATPNYWRIYQLAALGCSGGACAFPVSPAQRKFFYPPEVITATNTAPYDSVIAGSGDREHPLYNSSERYNDLFLIKDIYTGSDATGMATTTMGSLFNATVNPWDGTLNGYFITLGIDEKVVNAPLATAGFVYMGTNQPSVPSANACNGNLGTARGYQLSPFAGTYKSVVFNGGGLPPSPVSGIVNIDIGGVMTPVPFMTGGGNPNCTGGADCASALGVQKTPIIVPTNRSRTYRYIDGK